MTHAAVIQPPFPYCRLGLRVSGGALTAVDWLAPETPCRAPSEAVAAEAGRQLQAYFRDPCHVFTLPLKPRGTPFQQRVWSALRAIPPGTARSYAELARALGSAPRAVGGACRANPLPIIVPCHRVVTARGALGGYGGATTGARLAMKKWLLAHEGWPAGR